MTIEIKIPDLGDGVDSGDVLEVFVSEGDTITQGQDLIELETDKATVNVPASAGGKITKIHVTEGDNIPVGGVIVTIEPADADSDESDRAAPPEPKSQQPISQDSSTSKPDSQSVESQSNTDRPDVQATSQRQTLASGRVVTTRPNTKSAVKQATEIPVATNASQVAAGPAIRRLAREVGIDLANVVGTGDFGRITREDLMKAVRGGTSRKMHTRQSTDGQADDYGSIRIEKLSKIRQTIARQMHESWSTVPRVTNFDDADITELEKIRQTSKADYAERNMKLTTMPFVIKAVAMSLKSHPIINASIDLQQGQIIYKNYVNIGIAVDTERGLVVPTLRNVNELGISEIARQLSEMAESVRENNFSVQDLRGGTFTISNLGAIGGTYSTPIINVPQTAILLIGRSRKMPVVVEDEIKIRLMMPLSISYDHRLIDGGAAARFLNDVKSLLEAPSRLLLAF